MTAVEKLADMILIDPDTMSMVLAEVITTFTTANLHNGDPNDPMLMLKEIGSYITACAEQAAAADRLGLKELPEGVTLKDLPGGGHAMYINTARPRRR